MDGRSLADALSLAGVLPDEYGSLARIDKYGRYDIGGEIGMGDIENQFIQLPAARVIADTLLDVLPYSAQVRSGERIDTLLDEYQAADRPITKALRAADMTLEGAGLAADVVPGLKAIGAGIAGAASLVPLMLRRGKPLKNIMHNQMGSIGTPLTRNGEDVAQAVELPARIDDLQKRLESIGLVKQRLKGSAHSASKYLEIEDPVTGELFGLRIADHPRTSHAAALHDPPDFEITPDADLNQVIPAILEKFNVTRTQFGDELIDMGEDVAQSLPMDEASRMARAQDMGLSDEILYRGQPDVEGQTEFQPDYIGGRNNSVGAAWLTNDPEIANEYVPTRNYVTGEYDPGSGVMPLLAPAKQLNLTADGIGVEGYKELRRVYGEIGEDWGFEDFDSFVDVVTGGRMWEYPGDGTLRFQNNVLQALDEWPAVRLQDNTFGKPNHSVVVFDPKNLRSKFAKFDPAKRNSANILAGSAAGAVGAGMLLGPEDEAR